MLFEDVLGLLIVIMLLVQGICSSVRDGFRTVWIGLIRCEMELEGDGG